MIQIYDIYTEDKKSKNNCPVSVVVDKYTSLVMYNDDHNHGTVQSKTKMLAKQIKKNAVITLDVKTRKVLAEITTIVQNTEVTSMGSIPKKKSRRLIGSQQIQKMVYRHFQLA